MSEDARKDLRNLVASLTRLGSRVVWDGDDRVRSIAMFGKEIQDGHLSDLRKLPGLRELNLTKSRITDAGLFYVGKLTDIETLMLGGTSVTDEGLEQLQRLPRLKSLNLIGTGVTDVGLEYFRAASGLETIWLERTDISDRGLHALSDFPKLMLLDVGRTLVSDAGLEIIGTFTALEELNVSGCLDLKGTGFRFLSNLRKLEILWADSCEITDEALEHLVSLPLRVLYLNWTKITDQGLQAIRQIRSLTELQIMGTSVSMDAVERLREALPSCTVQVLAPR